MKLIKSNPGPVRLTVYVGYEDAVAQVLQLATRTIKSRHLVGLGGAELRQYVLNRAERGIDSAVADLAAGMHPITQRAFARELLPLLGASGARLIAGCYSPFLLDELPANKVVCVDANYRAAYLDSHPKYDRFKGCLFPGELWSCFGEGWLSAPGKDG